MALFTPSESPAVTIKEIDLTGVSPNVQSTTGAFVGNFSWGTNSGSNSYFHRKRVDYNFCCTRF